MPTLAEVLKSLLEEHQLSGTRLAKSVGLPAPTINRLVSGEVTDPKSSTLLAISNHFSITIDQLLGYSPIQKKPHKIEENIGQYQITHKLPFVKFSGLKKYRKGDPVEYFFDYPKALVPQGLVASKMSNDKFEPIFPKNSVLILNLNKIPQAGEYVAVSSGEQEITLKRYYWEDGVEYLYPLKAGLKIVEYDKAVWTLHACVVEAVIQFSE